MPRLPNLDPGRKCRHIRVPEDHDWSRHHHNNEPFLRADNTGGDLQLVREGRVWCWIGPSTHSQPGSWRIRPHSHFGSLGGVQKKRPTRTSFGFKWFRKESWADVTTVWFCWKWCLNFFGQLLFLFKNSTKKAGKQAAIVILKDTISILPCMNLWCWTVDINGVMLQWSLIIQ